MMRIVVVALVAMLGQVAGLLQTTPAGFAIISAGYNLPNGANQETTPDTSSNPANLGFYQYVVMGACIPTSNPAGGSVMYSYNAGSSPVMGNGGTNVPANGVVLDTWTTSATCSGTATTISAYQPLGGPGQTVTGAITYNSYLATLPPLPGTSTTQRLSASASACSTNAHFFGTVYATNVPNSVLNVAACSAANTGSAPPLIISTFTVASTSVFASTAQTPAASTNPGTTVVASTAGLAFFAQYVSKPYACGTTDSTGAVSTLPVNIFQTPPSTCTPFQLGQVDQYTKNGALSSQVIVYTVPGVVVGGQGTVRPQIISLVLYSGAGCTGNVLFIKTFLSSTTTCSGNFLAFYNPTATVSQQATVLAAIAPILPPSQQMSLTSVFQVNAFYPTVAACQASTGPQLVQYQLGSQGTLNTCAVSTNSAYTANNPSLFSNALCTTATSATANNFAQLQFFTDSACATPAIGALAYQVNVCIAAPGTSSFNIMQSTSASGTTTLVQNVYDNAACTAPASQQIPVATYTAATATTNCAIASDSTPFSPGYYMRYTQQTTLGTTLTGTANTGSANSVTWVANYNTQAGCSASTVANGVLYQGAIATCLPYTQPSPTSTPTAPALLTSTSFVSQTVQGCYVPNPTAAPSFASTIAPTAATATTTTVTAALASSGAAISANLNTALASAGYSGIVVSNPTTTVTSTGVSATQNIPSGVTVAQAQTAAFQTAFVSAVASAASVPTSSVNGYTATAGRRLLAGVNVAYTITVPGAPSNSPTSSPACFAGTERVTLENGATKAIADVQAGDRILTVNAKGEQVYSDVAYLPHGKNTETAVFMVLATEAGRDVKMTANHMLPAGVCSAASLPVVAASAVTVGDCVETVSGRERVVSVGTVAGEGIYTVIAMEELLVVNGVVATPYGGVNPALANVYYNIHRLAYSVAGKALLAVQGATEGVWAALALLAASR